MMVLLLALTLLQGAAPPAGVSGVVVDATGASVQGAVVTVMRSDASRSVVTGADGSWAVTLPLGPGEVEVRVTASGFASATRIVTLPSTGVRFELRPAAIAEAITVSAETTATRLAIDRSVTSLDRTSIATAPALR